MLFFFSNLGIHTEFGLGGTIQKKGPTCSPQKRILRDSLIIYDYLFIIDCKLLLLLKKVGLGTHKLEQLCIITRHVVSCDWKKCNGRPCRTWGTLLPIWDNINQKHPK